MFTNCALQEQARSSLHDVLALVVSHDLFGIRELFCFIMRFLLLCMHVAIFHKVSFWPRNFTYYFLIWVPVRGLGLRVNL